MKNFKHILCIVLAIGLIVSMFAGCGSSSSEASDSTAASEAETSESETSAEEESSEEATEAESSEEASAEEETEAETSEEEENTEAETSESGTETVALPICDEPTTFTHWTAVAPYASDVITDPAEDQAIFALLAEETNVNFDFITTPAQAESENFSIMITAGEYPQIIDNAVSLYTTGADGAVDEEVLVDLSDYLEEYAPNYTKLLDENAELKVAVTSDEGYIAGIARLYDEAGLENSGLLIRKDWLDELGLDVPRTYDDFYEVLTAFHNTYGGGTMMLASTGADSLIGAGYGINTGYGTSQNGYEYPLYVVDGEVRFGFLQDEFLDYLTTMNKWYSEGLIYQDFFTLEGVGIGNNYDLAINGDLGIAQGGANNIVSLRSMLDEGETLEMISLASPVLDESETCVHIGSESSVIKTTNAWCFSTTCTEDDLVTLCTLVNYLFSDEGNFLTNYGEDGVAHTIDEDGNVQWTELVTNNPDGLAYQTAVHLYASSVGTTIPQVFDISMVYYSFEDADWDNVSTLQNSSDNAYNYPTYAAMTVEETEEFNTIMSDVNTLMSEYIVSFITGTKSLDEFDSFRETLIEMGVEDAVAIKQAAYDRYVEKMAEVTG